MYQNVIFDLYGTLIDLHTDEDKAVLWEQMAKVFTFNGAAYAPEELKAAYQQKVQEDRAANAITSHPDVEMVGIFKRLLQDKGVVLPEDAAIQLVRLLRVLSTHYITTYEGVIDTLKLLKEKGKKLILLSNGQREFVVPEITMTGILPYLDAVYISSDYLMCKPDVKLYQEILVKENLNAAETVMVGNDHTTDIAGAHLAGMDGIYLYTNCSPEPGDFECKHKVMEGSFRQIADWIL